MRESGLRDANLDLRKPPSSFGEPVADSNVMAADCLEELVLKFAQEIGVFKFGKRHTGIDIAGGLFVPVSLGKTEIGGLCLLYLLLLHIVSI